MRPCVKKCALAAVLFFAAAFLFAQSQGENYYEDEPAAESGREAGQLDPYYFNLPIVKIFYHPRGYYILYRTSSLKIGKMYIPWEWMDYRDQRAVYNTTIPGVSPYITYVMNNGEFHQVRIYASANPRDATWGEISSARVPDEYFDADTVTLQF